MQNIENFNDLLNVIKKRIWILLVVICLFLAMGIIVTRKVYTPLYVASSTVMINESKNAQVYSNYVDANRKLAITYGQLINSKKVIEGIKEELDLSMTTNEIENAITIIPVNSTEVLSIIVRTGDPKLSIAIANKLPVQFKKSFSELVNVDSIKVVDLAERVTLENHSGTYVLISVIIGLLLGLAVIFFFEITNGKIRSLNEIYKCVNMRILGVIPGSLSYNNKSLIKSVFQNLYVSIRREALGKGIKVISLISDGKRLEINKVALNLCKNISNNGVKVLLINLNYGKKDKQFKNYAYIENMNFQQNMKDYIVNFDQELDLILIENNFSKALSSIITNSIDEMINKVKKDYDLIIILPSIEMSYDLDNLPSSTEGVIVLVSTKVNELSHFQHITSELEKRNLSSIGVIVNKYKYKIKQGSNKKILSIGTNVSSS